MIIHKIDFFAFLSTGNILNDSTILSLFLFKVLAVVSILRFYLTQLNVEAPSSKLGAS